MATLAESSVADELRLPAAACELLCGTLPRASSLDAALRIIEQVRQLQLGDGLLTINVDATPETAFDMPPGSAGSASDEVVELQRLWSSNPAAYPVGGRKRKPMTPWARQLLRRAELFIGEGDARLAAVFDDHARIASLGLHAVINVPLLAGGRCVATFNVLGSRAAWQLHEILLVRLLAVLAAPWVLAAR